MLSSQSSPIVCVGELLWDLLPSGARLGGATTNFSVLSARLGASATLVSRIGNDDLGRAAVDSLNTCKPGVGLPGTLDLSYLQRSEDLATGTVGVTLDAHGKPCYTIDMPVAWDQITLDAPLLDLAAHASAVYFGTLAQRQIPSRHTLQTIVESASPDCVCVCDANLRMPFCTAETLQWCLLHATVLKVSDEEVPDLGALLGLELNAHPEQVASALLTNAPRCNLVAITLGAQGSYLATRAAEHRHPGFSTTVADTIGAGDAFTAGMVHAYLRGGTLEQISVASNLCGSYVASQPGATPEFPDELLSRLRSIVES